MLVIPILLVELQIVAILKWPCQWPLAVTAPLLAKRASGRSSRSGTDGSQKIISEQCYLNVSIMMRL